MLFSLDWLREYVELPAEAEEVARTLTRIGHNVERIEETGGDLVLDVEVTTNRSDAMNHVGLARELAAAYGRELRPPCPAPSEVADDVESVVDEVAIAAPELCRRYVARVVRGVTVGPSPRWLVERLEAIGLRSVNNVVDATNYVLWELGQPLHAFDLDPLAERRVRVRRATSGETLRTIDGETRDLDDEALVIADGERPVALAGIMGGVETEVSEATRDVLLESAWFDPTSVRRTARRHGLHTDASHRFERGCDIEICRLAADRAAELILRCAGGEVLAGALDVRGEELSSPPSIELSVRRCERFAGTELDVPQVAERLERLGFGLESGDGDGAWMVEVPSWRRFDVAEEADLFEEVLRLHGYEAIPAALPSFAGADRPELEAHAARRRLRRHLAACGYAEAIDYAFYSRADDAAFPALVEGRAVALGNPLSDLYALMRRSLVPGLVESARFNRRRGAEAVRLFEVGHVFWTESPEATGDGDGRGSGSTAGVEPREREQVALVCGGVVGTPLHGAEELDFFALKGVVESLARSVGIAVEAREAALTGLVSGRCAELVEATSGERVGVIGEVAGDADPYPLTVAELDATRLRSRRSGRELQLPSRYPGIAVDSTLTHSLDVSWRSIESLIRDAAVDDLLAFEPIDRYTGEGVPPGCVNTTIRFRYNAFDRTLTQEEVNTRHGALVARLEERFGVTEEAEVGVEGTDQQEPGEEET